MTSELELEAARKLVACDRRIRALSRWHHQGSRPTSLEDPQAPLSPPDLQELVALLGSSEWFEIRDSAVFPGRLGRELLYRISELARQLDLELKGETPVEALEGIPPGAAVDIGCGVGYGMVYLGRAGCSPLHGYDLSPIALTLAQALLEREGFQANTYSADATLLSEIPDGEVAVIYSRIALYYFDIVRLANTFQRVLRPGGRVVAEVKAWQFYTQAIRDLARGRLRRAASYSRVWLRMAIFQLTGKQPKLGGFAPEIGWTAGTVRRFARLAGLNVHSCRYDGENKSLHFVLGKP